MNNNIIVLILFAILTISAAPALAETARVSAQKETTTPPANMDDAALASYISGRLTPLLKDSGYQVSQNCDSSGCSVVVQ
jgi:hypothetical protein